MSKQTSIGRPDIYRYEDFRVFLKDLFAFFKETKAYFSFRSLSKKAGFGSPNYLQSILDGKRNLSDDAVKKVIKISELSDGEARFFERLVSYAQATDEVERLAAYEKLVSNKKFQRYQPVKKAQLDYFTKWYFPVIRELVALSDFREDPDWISKQLIPNVHIEQVNEAIFSLLKLGFLVRDAEGKLRQSNPSVTTGNEIQSLHVLRFHQQILEKAKDAVTHISAEERDFRSLMFTCKPEQMDQLKGLIQEFREKLMSEFAECRPDDSKVCVLNVQLFPVTENLCPKS